MTDDDIGGFAPQNALEQRLAAAAIQPDQAAALRRAFLEAEVYAPTDGSIGEGERVFQPGDEIPLLAVEAPDGPPATAVFSSPERLREAFGGETPYLALPGVALLRLIRGDWLVVNPGLAYGAVWSPEDIETALSEAGQALSPDRG